MSPLLFSKLNNDWNAHPNAPNENVSVNDSCVELDFVLDNYAFTADESEKAKLSFRDCKSWRIGAVNDEGWYMGQCRFSRIAPAWGEFYEITGASENINTPTDWKTPQVLGNGKRHFLFYLKENTFECIAADWHFQRFGKS